MPIYEYQCRACQHELQVLQKMTEPPLLECPVCYQPTLQKLVSPAGLNFVGEGWFVNEQKQSAAKQVTTGEQHAGGGQDGADAAATGGTTEGTTAPSSTDTTPEQSAATTTNTTTAAGE